MIWRSRPLLWRAKQQEHKINFYATRIRGILSITVYRIRCYIHGVLLMIIKSLGRGTDAYYKRVDKVVCLYYPRVQVNCMQG